MSLLIQTVSDSSQARKDLEALKKSVGGIESSVKSATDGFQKLALGIGATVAALGSISALTKFSDSFTELENSITAVTKTQEEFNRALDGVKDIAIRSRSGLRETASLYSRIAVNGKALGINQGDTLKVTEALSKAMKIGKATAQESAAAMLQFGQAIGSGALQGDELRSLLETAPVLAKALAEEFKVGVGDLKKMGEEGKLVSGKVLKAVLSKSKEINEEYARMKITFSGAFSNLGTSLSLLGNELSKAIFGSNGFGLADFINDQAIAIKRLSDNFKFYLLRIKTAILFFVIDARELFIDMWPALEETALKLRDVAVGLYEQWKPELTAATAMITGWAASVVDTVYGFFNRVTGTALFQEILSALTDGFNAARDFVEGVFKDLNIEIPSIDITKFFKGFEPMLDFLQGWVKKAERAFFWLYDEVIGHSWIPDLVLETGQWLKKLLGAPLNMVETFTGKSSKMFSGLAIATPFAASFGVLKMFGSKMLFITGLVLSMVSAFMVLGGNGVFGDKIAVRVTGFFDVILKRFKGFQDSFKKMAESSVFMRTAKQILGMQDKAPGSIFGSPIDTRDRAKVGRGPHRSQEDRPIGHDVINALPKDWQIPVLAGVTGVFGLAIVKAFDSGPVRSVLLSALTTAFGLAVVQNVDDSTIKKTTAAIGYGFIDIVGKGLDFLLSGNALKDPLGTLSLLAKTSLLFEDGRKAALEVTKAIVTAPTRLASNVNDMALRGLARMSIARGDAQLAALPLQVSDGLKKANEAFNSSLTRLANIRDSSGQMVGALKAMQMAQTGQLAAGFNGIKAANALNIALEAGRIKQKAEVTNAIELEAKKAELQAKREVLVNKEAEISRRLKEAGDAFKQGFKDTAAGLGGTLGGLGGFQIGTAIAREMGDSVSNWQKVGIAISASVVGQGLGALLGAGLSSALIWGGGIVAGAIAAAFTVAPFIAGGVVIVAAIAAGYALFEALPETWKKALFGDAAGEAKVKNEAIAAAEQSAKNGGLTQADAVKLGETIRDNSEAWFGASASMQVMGTSLTGMERQAVITAANQPTAAERAENLATTKAVVDAVKSLPSALYNGIGNLLNYIRDKATGFASGGRITGPGSSTSDSIPAMLSNGEFVVNARAAGKNRRLLEAINSGRGTSFFAGGGSTSEARYSAISGTPYGPNNPLNVTDKSLGDKIASYTDRLKAAAIGADGKFSVSGLATEFGKVAGDLVKAVEGKKPAPITGGGQTDTRTGFRRSLEGKNPDKTIADALANAGVGGLDSSSVGKLSIDVKSMIAESLDNIARAQSKLAANGGKGQGPFLNAQLKDNIAEQTSVVNGILRKANAKGELPSSFSESDKGKKDTKQKDVLFGEQLKIINETFPDLGLALKEFIDLTDDSRETLYKSAKDIYDETARINELPIGKRARKSKVTGETEFVDGAAEALQLNERARQEAQQVAIDNQKAARSLFGNVGALFQEVNIGLTQLQTESLLAEDADLLTELARQIKDLTKQQAAVKDNPAERIRLAELIKEKSEAMQSVVTDSMIRAAKSPEATMLLGSKVGIAVERSVSNRLSDADRAILDGYLKSISDDEAIAKTGATAEIRAEAQKRADAARKKANEAVEKAGPASSRYESLSKTTSKIGVSLEQGLYNSLTDAQQTVLKNVAEKIQKERDIANNDAVLEADRRAAQARADAMTEQLRMDLEKIGRDSGKEAGKAFASGLKEAFTSAFSGALKGQKDDNRTILLTLYDKLLDSTTNSVIDTFSKSMSDKLLGEGSGLSTALASLGTGVSNSVTTLFTSLSGVGGTALSAVSGILGMAPKNAAPEASSDANEVPSLFSSITTAITGLGTMLGLPLGIMSAVSVSSQITDALGVTVAQAQLIYLGSLGITIPAAISVGSALIVTAIGALAAAILGTQAADAGGDLMKLLFAADGGKVTGPGSSRSDSVPAMLSNGEFVINARAAGKYMPLLSAINSGRMSHFADGGLVSPVNIATIESGRGGGFGGSTSNFNINITGDISNQTRSEIQRMIPQIAAGVGSHNYEKGRR